MKKKEKLLKERIIDGYANFVSSKSLIVILTCVALLILANYGSSLIKNESVDYANLLPQDEPVIAANNLFSDAFGSTERAMVVLEINPQNSRSDEVRDIRDPRVLIFADQLTSLLYESSQVIEEINSPSLILRELNGGILPSSISKVREFQESSSRLDDYISEDNSMMILSINLLEGKDPGIAADDIEESIASLDVPPGVSAVAGGDALVGVYIDRQIGGDMNRTSLFSMVAIIIILFLVFASFKYGLLPLTTIIVGVMWTFGFVGLVGIPMTSMTSGVMSMIMGIGIDFGIQIITRFRQELRELKGNIQRAMRHTMNSVLVPLLTTTLAAVIGFQSMTLGDLAFLADMGHMMTYGVVFCFLAAITIVPALTVFIEKFHVRIKLARKN